MGSAHSTLSGSGDDLSSRTSVACPQFPKCTEATLGSLELLELLEPNNNQRPISAPRGSPAQKEPQPLVDPAELLVPVPDSPLLPDGEPETLARKRTGMYPMAFCTPRYVPVLDLDEDEIAYTHTNTTGTASDTEGGPSSAAAVLVPVVFSAGLQWRQSPLDPIDEVERCSSAGRPCEEPGVVRERLSFTAKAIRARWKCRGQEDPSSSSPLNCDQPTEGDNRTESPIVTFGEKRLTQRVLQWHAEVVHPSYFIIDKQAQSQDIC